MVSVPSLSLLVEDSNRRKHRVYNLFKKQKDAQNSRGWSVTQDGLGERCKKQIKYGLLSHVKALGLYPQNNERVMVIFTFFKDQSDCTMENGEKQEYKQEKQLRGHGSKLAC